MKTKNKNAVTPSLRVLHDIKTEAQYLEEHPELDNVSTFHCWKALSRTALYLDRNGKFALCYDSSHRLCWRLRRFYNHVSAGMKRIRINRQYSSFHYHFKCSTIHVFVHQVIAHMFINRDNLFATELDHLDGNIYNNRYDNLEYVTHQENIRRRFYNYYSKQGRPVPAKFQTVY